MPKITKIKAGDSRVSDEPESAAITRKKVVVKDKKTEKTKLKAQKAAEKAVKGEGKEKKPFILIRPFVYLGRYFRDSWKELRQVRWPNRKATWKMVFAVFVYTAAFLILITLLDLLFKWLFGLILGN